VPKSLIFGGLAALACVHSWIYELETAGRTYKELDELFTSKAAGRKLKSTKTQTELGGVQAKDIQAEKTQGEHNV
jgi:MFS transporter, SP family, general alpha glucoside:H+ symporter